MSQKLKWPTVLENLGLASFNRDVVINELKLRKHYWKPHAITH